jgi:hypothetical protein
MTSANHVLPNEDDEEAPESSVRPVQVRRDTTMPSVAGRRTSPRDRAGRPKLASVPCFTSGPCVTLEPVIVRVKDQREDWVPTFPSEDVESD